MSARVRASRPLEVPSDAMRILLFAIVLQLGVAGAVFAAAATRPNVLIVTLDTTRADHTSAYGYARPTTPGQRSCVPAAVGLPGGARGAIVT